MRQLSLRFSMVLLASMLASTAVAQTALPPGASSSDGQTADAEAFQSQQRLPQTISEVGVVESADVIEIQSQAPGETIVVSVLPDGARVKAGDLLVELDDSAIRRAIQDQQLKLAQFKAAVERAAAAEEEAAMRSKVFLPYAQLKLHAAEIAYKRYLASDGEYALDVAHADRQITLAQNQLDVVEVQKKNVSRPRDMDWAVDDAKVELRLAKDTKKLLTDHVHEHEKTILQVAIAEAQTDLVQMDIELEGNVRDARADAQTEQLAYELERVRLDDLQTQLAHCRILAPRDGVVVHATSNALHAPTLEPGATVRERQTLMMMPNLDRLFVKINVNETQISRIGSGQSVTLSVDAMPTQKYVGRVTDVAPVPNRQFAVNSGVVHYGVHVTIDDMPAQWRLGMSVLAEIPVQP